MKWHVMIILKFDATKLFKTFRYEKGTKHKSGS